MPIRPLLDLRPLADDTLISRLKSLVHRERDITLAVLLHLIEVERRGLHLRRYSSLFLYCVDRLGYSRSAAGRRIYAARCLRDFPRVYEMLVQGRLNLTTVCLVARVLTKENEADLLKSVAGKSEKEVERIVAALSRPVHPREIIRPVRVHAGSAGNRAGHRLDPNAGAPLADAANAGVPGADASSADFANPYAPSVGVPNAKVPNPDVSTANVPAASSGGDDATTSDANGTTSHASTTTRAVATDLCGDSPVSPCAGAAGNPPTACDSSGAEEAPLAYRIAITVDDAFMEKLERARALVSRSRPGVSVADVFGRTLDEFLVRHDPEERMARRQQRTEKKTATTCGTPQAARSVDDAVDSAAELAIDAVDAADLAVDSAAAPDINPVDAADPAIDAFDHVLDPVPSFGVDPVANHAIDSAANDDADPAIYRDSQRSDSELQREIPPRSSHPGFITAAMRDAVWARDGGRCTFVGPEGRCTETRGLHVDHRDPKCLGGVAELSSLRLLCSLHNQAEADRVLGKAFMDLRRRRTPGPGVAAPQSLRSTSGGTLSRVTRHVECPKEANRDST